MFCWVCVVLSVRVNPGHAQYQTAAAEVQFKMTGWIRVLGAEAVPAVYMQQLKPAYPASSDWEETSTDPNL